MSVNYDVIVIGGGPAGMMAAGRAAELGARVLLLEKNPGLGKKLLITGGGRCNVTNAEFDQHIFLEKFRQNAKFLFSSFSQFGVSDTFEFFEGQGMPMKVEAEKRAFPKSEKASSVLEALEKYMALGKVTVQSGAEVVGLEGDGGILSGVRLKDGTLLEAQSYVLATGGKSRPETGSTGEGFEWLRSIGHTVLESDPSLVPVKIKEEWVRKLSGLSLKDVKLTLLQNNKKQVSKKGKMLFTHFGLSGPLVLNMSKDIGELLKYGSVEVSLDLMPTLDSGATDRRIQEVFREFQNKKVKNTLSELVMPTLAPVLIELSGIDGEMFVNKVPREERLKLTRLLKDLRMTVTGLLGVEKAIVTSGGVTLEEVDFKTMQSRICPNLYVVGDILNIDRPSGGYSLQLCFTTGFVAGTAAATQGKKKQKTS